MITNTWTLSAVELPGGVIHQIQDYDIDPGLQEIMEGGSGTVDPEFAAFAEQAPGLSFTTTAVATALALAGISGAAIAATTNLYFVRNEQGSTRATGANNAKMTITNGMIIPTVLQAGNRPPASISYDIMAISPDGTTAPISFAIGATLPSISRVNEIFCVGPVKVNSITFPSIQSLSVNFGIGYGRLGGNGEAYPTFCGINSRNPRISVTDLDLSKLVSGSVGVNGLALTTWSAYLRKMTEGSATRVSNGTTSHIKISGTLGIAKPTRIRAQHQREASNSVDIGPTMDGTNPIMSISTGSAIT